MEEYVGTHNILFTAKGDAITPDIINEEIILFKKYNDAVDTIIKISQRLDSSGSEFFKCATIILKNFGMTRSGPFMGLKTLKNGNVNHHTILQNCWNEIKEPLITIRKSIPESGCSRDRYLLSLEESELEELLAIIWDVTKRLLPYTMGETSYGLVGASKILFSVLPEIVLPIDNSQWLHVFKTVDLGDVIRKMVAEIKDWEGETSEKLNKMDKSNKLTTLPSVYNVMAMSARPKKKNK